MNQDLEIIAAKVLWITSSYPRFENDSASIFLQNLAREIHKNNYEVHVLAPDDLEIDNKTQNNIIAHHYFKYFLPRRLQKLAYGSGILPNLKKNPFLFIQIPCFMIMMFFFSWRLIKIIRPNLIHAHWIFPQGFIAVLLGKLCKVPVIITAHGSDTFELKSTIIYFLKRWSLSHCNAWTSNTHATANEISHNLPMPKIIPMGVFLKDFSLGNRNELRRLVSDDSLIILFIGRLYLNKGVKELIKAFSLISNDLKNKTQLWIVGDGIERKNLEEQSRLLGLEKNIIFYGRYPNDQLPNFYAAADILISPSITPEGQGLTILEAFASQTSVICSRNGAVLDFVEHRKNGLLINPEDTNAFKDAIEELLTNIKLRESLACEGNVTAQRYDWLSIGQRFSELYSSVSKCSG